MTMEQQFTLKGQIADNGERVLHLHSPTSGLLLRIDGKFEWGQRNNLACNTARAILSKLHPAAAQELEVAYVEEVVSKLDPHGFTIPYDVVTEWIKRHEA